MEVNSSEADTTAIFDKHLQAHNAGDLSLYLLVTLVKGEAQLSG